MTKNRRARCTIVTETNSNVCYFVIEVVFKDYKQELIIAFFLLIGNVFENAFHMNEESVEVTAMEEKVEVPKEAAPEAAAPKVAPVVATSKESVPCFGATPFWKKEPIFVDENE